MKILNWLLIFVSFHCFGTSITKGNLQNGLKYYVVSHPEGEASTFLKMVVNVGAIHETENEKGIAHLVEHMVFRGTTHFPGRSALNFLESQGIWLGVDVNALTGLDTTCYEMEIPNPTQENLDQTLRLLSDFASCALMDQETLHKEKGVVLDELRQLKTEEEKGREIFFHLLTQGTAYEGLDPGGDPQIVEKISAKDLQAFYHKWYRPERTGIIVVGDLDEKEVIQMIETHFGAWRPEGEPTHLELPSDVKRSSRVGLYQNPYLLNPSVSVATLDSLNKRVSLEEMVIDELWSTLLQDRLERLADLYPQLFRTISLRTSQVSDYLLLDEILLELLNGSVKEGLSLVYQELRHLEEGDMTPEELQFVKEQFFQEIKEQFAFSEENSYWAGLCEIDLFGFTDFDFTTLKEEDILRVATEVTLEMMHQNKMKFDCHHLFLQLPVEENSLTEGEVASWITETKAVTSLPLFEKNTPEIPLYVISQEGTILSEIEKEGVYEWILSNGSKVIFQPTAASKNQKVVLSAFSKKGWNLFSPKEMASAHLAKPYFETSGIVNFPRKRLSSFLDRNKITIDFDVGLNFRTITCTAFADQLENALNILHQQITAPVFDTEKWPIVYESEVKTAELRSRHPEIAFHDFVRTINYGGHSLFQTPDLKEAKEEEARCYFKQMFCAPQEFTFVIAGFMEVQEVKTVVQRYLASIPSYEEKERSVGYPTIEFPSKTIKETFCKGTSEEATTVITIPFNFKKSLQELEDSLAVHASLILLESRLRGLLREDMGETYDVSVRMKYPYYPDREPSWIEIKFTSKPTSVDAMVTAVFSQIDHLKEQLPDFEETASIRELLWNVLTHESRSNGEKVSTLLEKVQAESGGFKGQVDLDQTLEKLNRERFQVAAKMIFAHPIYTVLTHLPEEVLALN